MSEITVETGELAVCVNCQLKHAVGLLHHVDPSMEKSKYDKTVELINEIREGLMMTSQEVEDFIAVNELEHKVEDALTVLRDLRHKIMEGSEERFESMEKAGLLERLGSEVNNPGNPEIPERCEFVKEPVKPKGYFDPDSFRTICPECPESRCSLCPPELACATRIITGCKEGEFIKGRCRIGTEAHTIYHGTPKRGTGRLTGTAKEPTGPEGYLTEEERIQRHILHHGNPDGTCATIRDVLESECRKAKRLIESTEEFQREGVKVTWPFCEVLNYHFTECSKT